MSTTPVDSWAVDLADVTLIYPWVGTEVLMVLVAVVLWIGWHVWQCKLESNTYKEDCAATRSTCSSGSSSTNREGTLDCHWL